MFTEAEKIHLLFAGASQPMFWVNVSDGTIVGANRSAAQALGGESTVLSKNLSALCKLPADVYSHPGTYEQRELRLADGCVHSFDIQVRVSGNLALVTFNDLTVRRELERELLRSHVELRQAHAVLEAKTVELSETQTMLVQAGKMAALGELSTGIAHELNQPLQTVRGFAQELKAMLPVNTTESTFTQHVIDGVDKIASIIQALRSFIRGSTDQYATTGVQTIIENAVQLLRGQLQSKGIRLQIQAPSTASVAQVFGNPVQIEQVLVNLLTNARDAIVATGRGAGTIRIETVEQADTVEIRVQDDGCGMDVATQQKVFNPFFTTKETGEGMGLGMSISYGIIDRHRGLLIVDSSPGRGTTFTVRLPKNPSSKTLTKEGEAA